MEEIGLQPQRCRRQVQEKPRPGGQEAAGLEPRPGPGHRWAARPRQPPGQAQAVEAAVEVGHERALATEQMAAAGEVDGEPVGAVDHDARAVAGAPQAERRQLLGVGRGLASRTRGPGRPRRIGQRQPRRQAEGADHGSDRRQPRHTCRCHQRQRRIFRRNAPLRRAFNRMRSIGHSGSHSER